MVASEPAGDLGANYRDVVTAQRPSARQQAHRRAAGAGACSRARAVACSRPSGVSDNGLCQEGADLCEKCGRGGFVFLAAVC